MLRTEFFAVNGRRNGADEQVLEEVLFRCFRHSTRLNQLTDHVLQVLAATTTTTIIIIIIIIINSSTMFQSVNVILLSGGTKKKKLGPDGLLSFHDLLYTSFIHRKQ